MRIPLEFYELLREKIILSEVISKNVFLIKKSSNYLGLCPFHQEKTPSFTVNNNKKFYYCFGCTTHGDVIRFVANINGLSYKDAAIKIAGDYGIALPNISLDQQLFYENLDKLLDVLEEIKYFFQSQLNDQVYDYLFYRGINKSMIEMFSIGFAPSINKLQSFCKKKSISSNILYKIGLMSKTVDNVLYYILYNRIVFPIINIYDKVIGFGGRIFNDNSIPKYLNCAESVLFQKNRVLYGENHAINAIYKKNYVILVEGYLDVIILHQAGFNETVASLGTAISIYHLKKLWKISDEIIVCLDSDTAGIQASKRLINLALPLIQSNKKLSFIILPLGHDPNSIIIKFGFVVFNKLLNERVSLSEMIWKFELKNNKCLIPEDSAFLEKKLKYYSNLIQDKTLGNYYLKFFKDKIWNLSRRLPKNSIVENNINRIFSINLSFSELEILEQVFCLLMIVLPQVMQISEVKEFFMCFKFCNNVFSDFRDWYFNTVLIDKINIINKEYIENMIEKSRFRDTILLLLRSNNLLLKVSFNNNNILM